MLTAACDLCLLCSALQHGSPSFHYYRTNRKPKQRRTERVYVSPVLRVVTCWDQCEIMVPCPHMCWPLGTKESWGASGWATQRLWYFVAFGFVKDFFFFFNLWDPIQAPPPSLWPGRTCPFMFHWSTVRQTTEWPGIILWITVDSKREIQQATLAICQWFPFSINSSYPQHGSLLSLSHFCHCCPARCDHEETGQGSSTFLSPKFDVFVCFFVLFQKHYGSDATARDHIHFIIFVIYVLVVDSQWRLSSLPNMTALNIYIQMLFIITSDCWAQLHTYCAQIKGRFQRKAARNMKCIQTTRGGSFSHSYVLS